MIVHKDFEMFVLNIFVYLDDVNHLQLVPLIPVKTSVVQVIHYHLDKREGLYWVKELMLDELFANGMDVHFPEKEILIKLGGGYTPLLYILISLPVKRHLILH